jgi:hypothetical protein
MEFIMKFGIKFNCKVSVKREIEGKVGNLKRRVSDCSKDYGLQGLKFSYVLLLCGAPSSIP